MRDLLLSTHQAVTLASSSEQLQKGKHLNPGQIVSSQIEDVASCR